MKKFYPIIGIIALLFSSCVSNSEHENALAEIKSLQKKCSELTEEVEKYKTNPEKLSANARMAFEGRNDTQLTEIRNTLLKYHPESDALKATNKFIADLNSIKKQELLAKEAKIKAEKERRMTAVKRLKKNYDDVSGITWYKNPYFTHYNNENLTSLYIGKSKTNVWLRLKMSYQGDDWIFFENAYLSYDGNTHPIIFDRYDNKETENSGGGVWEWIDVSVDDSTLAFLKQMIEGKELKMRLSGKYTRTRNLSYNEKRALVDVLLAYDVLKEEINN